MCSISTYPYYIHILWPFDQLQESTNISPYEALFGRIANLPIDFNQQYNYSPEDELTKFYNAESPDKENEKKRRDEQLKAISDNIAKAQEQQKRQYDRRYAVAGTYSTGILVLKKDLTRKKRKGGKLDEKWEGPFQIIANLGKGMYRLEEVRNKKILQRVCGMHMKPYRVGDQQLDDQQLNDPQLDDAQLDDPQLDDQQLNDPQLDDAQLDDLQLDDQQLNDPPLDDPQLDDQQLDDPQLDDQQLDDQQLNDPQLDDPQLDDQQLDDQQLNDPQLDEAQLDDQQLDDQQLNDPQLDDPQLDDQQLNDPQLDDAQLDDPQLDDLQPAFLEGQINNCCVHASAHTVNVYSSICAESDHTVGFLSSSLACDGGYFPEFAPGSVLPSPVLVTKREGVPTGIGKRT